jgi:hypothetical protein
MFVFMIACGSNGDSDTGSGGASGASVSSGSSGGGGSNAGNAGSGGADSAGTSSTGAGGVASSGGAGNKDAGMNGGAGGQGGSTDAGVSRVTASAGCSKGSGRPADGNVTVANAYYLSFPSTYDGKTPMPVLLGFHGCGAVNRGTNIGSTEWMMYTKGTPFETDYVRAVPVSQDPGGCWTYDADMPRATKMYDDLVTNYCVDTSRVFATGHSSGAQFVVQQILAKKMDADHFKLRGVAPVSADPATLAGPMPVMYIDGQMDNQRSPTSAVNTVKDFRVANACADTSKPYAPVMSCKSSEGPMVDPGCIIYDNCTVPTIWCSHNDPFYSGTQHGVPCFAVKAMYDFFKTLQ